MQSWLTKEPSWIYWIKSPEGFWIKQDFGNIVEAQKEYLKEFKSRTALRGYPGFHPFVAVK